MKLVKLSATALTISIVATVLIKADQFLSRDSLGQKTKDPVKIQNGELIDKDTIISEEAVKPTNESLLVEKIEKLTARINELEAELINQQAEEEAIKVENELKAATTENSDKVIPNKEVKSPPAKPAPIVSNDSPAPRAEPVLSGELFPEEAVKNIEPELPSFSPDLKARHDFGEALEPYGNWMRTLEYGDVWKPRISNPTVWAPYTVGRWHYTELGWHFTSSEPWGWACYHYGRWVRYRTVGWCWVPGREWAPAWVSWRTSPRHIGWSPLPPAATWNRRSGIRHWADNRFNIGPSHYNFIRVEDFNTRNCYSSLVNRRQNASLMLSTNNVTLMFSISLGGRDRICNRGPDRNYLTKHHHQDHRPLRISRNHGKRGAQNQVNIINQEIVIHQRVENKTEINLSKSVKTNRIDNEEIDQGWGVVDSENQKTLLRRHIVSDSKRPNSRTVTEYKDSKIASNPKIKINSTGLNKSDGRVSNVVVPNLPNNTTTLRKTQPSQKKIEENKARITVQERQRQELAQRKAQEEQLKQTQAFQKKVEENRARIVQENQKREQELAQRKAQEKQLRQAQANQKKVEENRARIAQEKQRQELAQRKAQEEQLRQARAFQKKVEENRARIVQENQKREQELARRKAQEEQLRQAQANQKKVEENRARIAQEKQRQELAQRKAQEEQLRQARAFQKKVEENRARIVQENQKREQELARRKAQEEQLRQAQANQKKVEENRARIAQEKQRQELAQRKAQEEQLRQARAFQKKVEENRARIVQENQKREQELARRKAQEEQLRQSQAYQRKIEEQRRRLSTQNLSTKSPSRSIPQTRSVIETPKSKSAKNTRSFSRSIPTKKTSSNQIQKSPNEKTSKTFSRRISK